MGFSVHIDTHPCNLLAERLCELVNSTPHRVFHIAFSGGKTPLPLFSLLSSDYRDRLPWKRIYIYQVDERCVPPSDSRSNWYWLSEMLVNKVGVLNAFRIPVEYEDADAKYEKLLRNQISVEVHGVPQLDVVLLGVGEDGHTASLFPGSKVTYEERRLVVRVEDAPGGLERISMTFPILSAAKVRFFLVTGVEKADVVAAVLQGGNYPATRLALNGEWFLDREAGSRVQNIYS